MNSIEKFEVWLKDSCNFKNKEYVHKISEALLYIESLAIKLKCTNQNILEMESLEDFYSATRRIKGKNFFIVKDKISKYIYTKSLDLYIQFLSLDETVDERATEEKASAEMSNNEAMFHDWMLKKEGLSINTTRNYISSINNITHIGFRNKLIHQALFFYPNINDMKQVYHSMLENEEFQEKNKINHNQYSAALAKYLKFLNEETGTLIDAQKTTSLVKIGTNLVSDKEKAFITWMTVVEQLSQNTARNYLSAIHNISNLCLKGNIADNHLLDLLSVAELNALMPKIRENNEFIEKNKQMRNQYVSALNKYIRFLGGDASHGIENTALRGKGLKYVYEYISDNANYNSLDERIISVLENIFANGINLNSVIHVRRFTNELKVCASEMDFQDEQAVIAKIQAVAINCHDQIYMAPNSVISIPLLQEVLEYTVEMLTSGKNIIYVENLYLKFKDKLIYTKVYDKEVLSKVLMNYLGDDVIYSRGTISTDRKAKFNIDEEVLDVLLASEMPLSRQAIYDMLPHIIREKIDFFLKSDSRAVYVLQGVYWHIDRFEVSQEDKYLLEDIIRYEIQEGFISSKKLLEILKIQAPAFVEKNSIVNYVCLKDILKYHFADMFGFKFTFIGKHGEEMSGVVATKNFISDKEEFTLAEFIDFISENELPTLYGLFFNEISKNFMRINREYFVRKEKFVYSFQDIQKIEETLDKFLENGYVPINKIDSFSLFPTIYYKWNGFLLRSVVDNLCQKYDVFDFSNSASKLTGVIVLKTAPFKDYDALLEDALVRQEIHSPFNHIDEAMEFLFINGYLAQRRYKNSEAIYASVKRRNLQIEGLE